MAVYHARRAMTRAIMISLGLHAGLVLLAVVLAWPATPEREKAQLRLELAGMVANRQHEARSAPPAQAPRPTPPAPPTPPPKKTPPPPRMPPRQARQQTPPPLQVEQADHGVTASVQAPAMQQSSQSPVQPPATAAPSASAVSAVSPQAQTKLSDAAKATEDDEEKYIESLGRKIRTHLVYPQEAMKAGYEGTTQLEFTIEANGTIRPGTLKVARSAGYPSLDASAIRAAQDSQPFEHPPKVMVVHVEVVFKLAN